MDKSDIQKYFVQRFDSYLTDLKRMVDINSRHKDPAGNKKINEWLRQHITTTGGRVISHSENGLEHLIGEYSGTGKVKIALIVHIDTVLDNTDFSFSYDSVTKIAKGPGVGDCKASVIMAMHVVQAFHDLKNFPFKLLSVYYDAEEEGGSPLEERIVEELAKTHDYVLVADTGRPDYGIVVRRKSSARLRIEIFGINGHGGNALQAGANTLYEAAFLLTKLYAVQTQMPENHDPRAMTREALLTKGIRDHGQFIPENSLNVRTLKHNQVNIPDYTEIVLGLACFDPKERTRIIEKIKAICQHPHIPGCRIECEIIPVMDAMLLSNKLVDLYKQTAEEYADITVSEWQAGGLTMANIASQFCPTIDGVGVDCDPLIEHTTDEAIDLNTAIPRLVTMYFFIQNLNNL